MIFYGLPPFFEGHRSGQRSRIHIDDGVRPALSSAISDSRLASRASIAARQSFSSGVSEAAGGAPVKEGLSAAAGYRRWAKVSARRPSPTGIRLTSGPCGYSMNHVSVSSTVSGQQSLPSIFARDLTVMAPIQPVLDGLTGRRAGFDPVDGQQCFKCFRGGVVHHLFEDPLEVDRVSPRTATSVSKFALSPITTHPSTAATTHDADVPQQAGIGQT